MAKEQRLSAHLAQRDGVRTRTNKEFTEIKNVLKREEFFAGLTKSYEKKDETGDDFPTQAIRVRCRVLDVLEQLRELGTQQFNAEATVDKGNLTAKASVEVNGTVILEDIPVVTLLTLERDLKQVREFVSKLPTLDPAFEWSLDSNAGVFKTQPLRTNREAKKQEAITLAPATTEHPAQTQLISVTSVVGEWVTVSSSGAIEPDTKKKYLKRCDTLINAMKVAREDANAARVAEVEVGTPIFNFLFGE